MSSINGIKGFANWAHDVADKAKTVAKQATNQFENLSSNVKKATSGIPPPRASLNNLKDKFTKLEQKLHDKLENKPADAPSQGSASSETPGVPLSGKQPRRNNKVSQQPSSHETPGVPPEGKQPRRSQRPPQPSVNQNAWTGGMPNFENYLPKQQAAPQPPPRPMEAPPKAEAAKTEQAPPTAEAPKMEQAPPQNTEKPLPMTPDQEKEHFLKLLGIGERITPEFIAEHMPTHEGRARLENQLRNFEGRIGAQVNAQLIDLGKKTPEGKLVNRNNDKYADITWANMGSEVPEGKKLNEMAQKLMEPIGELRSELKELLAAVPPPGVRENALQTLNLATPMSLDYVTASATNAGGIEQMRSELKDFQNSLQKTFRKETIKYHSDKVGDNPAAKQKFEELTNAKDALQAMVHGISANLDRMEKELGG